MKELFKTQQKYINKFFDNLNIKDFEHVLNLILECTGTVFFTGVGKSGFIANKIAMTMLSTGTKALFLPPTDALHGDLGIVSDKDVFICLSKGGESDELINLIPYVKKKGAYTIALVSNMKSRLSKLCDFAVDLHVERELCPFDLAPTTSPTVQLIFGDVLAIALMQKRNFSLDDYAKNHPAGKIGKRIAVTVEDIMLKERAVPKCLKEDKLVDVLVEFSDKRCGCLLVVDKKDNLLGIFTDGDLRRAIQANPSGVLQTKMMDLMKQSPRSISKNVLAYDALKQMEKDPAHPIMVLPVLDNKRVIGLLKMHDILQAGI